MNKKKILTTLFVVVGFGIMWRFFTFYTVDDSASHQQDFNDKYYVFALSTPKNMSFAGDKIPVEQFDVRERMDRELLTNTYWQSQTMLLHKRSARWFPVISPILKRNGIPEDFKYLALAESGFTHVTSPAGAVGFWQFLETTGKNYGLEINDDVDERYNVEKATEAACKYFKEAYGQLGNWSLVAASYNMGIGGVRKQIDKQKVYNYYDLLLNDETFRYVFRVLALKEIISNPTKYGYRYRKSDLYSPFEYTVVKVDTTISNLTDFAASQGTNYKNLKILNPWLRQANLPNKQRKTYEIKIVKSGYTGIEGNYDYKNADSVAAVKPQSAIIEPNSVITADAASSLKAKKVTHKVKSGESLANIAKEYKVTEDDIKLWNDMPSNNVKKGKKLVIYTTKAEDEVGE